MARRNNASIIGLHAQHPACGPAREVDGHVTRITVEHLDAHIIATANDALICAVEMQRSDEARVPMKLVDELASVGIELIDYAVVATSEDGPAIVTEFDTCKATVFAGELFDTLA